MYQRQKRATSIVTHKLIVTGHGIARMYVVVSPEDVHGLLARVDTGTDGRVAPPLRDTTNHNSFV